MLARKKPSNGATGTENQPSCQEELTGHRVSKG